jgi:hypothetical protein
MKTRYTVAGTAFGAVAARFDRDWFRSMGGRAHQGARPLDRSGDRTFPTYDERKGPP